MNVIAQTSYGTLYPVLHKLLNDGAVEVKEVSQKGRPSKKIYQITQVGREELAEWLRRPAAADQVKREFLLKLYLAKDLAPQQLFSLVHTRRGEVEAMLQALHTQQNEITSPQYAWVLDYALSLAKTEVDWLKQLEAKIGVA